MPDYTLERAVSVAKTLGKRRTINQQHITLSAGLTQIKEDDTSDSIITRCLESYNEAINDATHSRILYNE